MDMKIVAFLFTIVLLASCSGSVNTSQLAGADSLVITFNGTNSDSIIKKVSTKEAKAIKKLSNFLDGKETEQFKCGYDGNLVFYKKGVQLLPVIFKYSEEGCRHFLFDSDGKVRSVAMSSEAESFFKSMIEGKAWY